MCLEVSHSPPILFSCNISSPATRLTSRQADCDAHAELLSSLICMSWAF